MEHTCDTVIIGAGLAGISAARTFETFNQSLRREDRTNYVVLEASDKIGGRVQSEKIATPDGRNISVELGAAWAHCDTVEGSAENPLLPHIRQSGKLVHDDMAREFWIHGQRLNFNKNIARIDRAHNIIREYRDADISVADLFDQSNLGSDTSSLVSTFGPPETGKPLSAVGVEDMREIVSRNMGEFLRGGLGNFIRDFAKPVERKIKLNTPVTKICWHTNGSEGIDIHTKNGDIYHAKHCVITVSVGVLKSGAITFEPPLPEAYQENLSRISMGDFNKVFLLFDEKFEFPVNSNTHLDVRTKCDQDIFYLARGNGQTLVTAFMGDDLARLCDSNPGSLEDLASNPNSALAIAIRGLAEIWGENVRDHVIKSRVTQWGKDPLVCGGYSCVDVGYHHARDALAEPIDDRLFLAGEAVGAKNPQTGQNWATHMPGAALSGERAANAVIAAMEKVNPLPYRHLIATDLGNAIARRT